METVELSTLSPSTKRYPSREAVPKARRSRSLRLNDPSNLGVIEEALTDPSQISRQERGWVRFFRLSWWNPRFNSRPLERQLQKKAIEFLRNRYGVTVFSLSVFSLLWIVFFSIQIPLSDIEELPTVIPKYSIEMIAGGAIFFAFSSILLILSRTRVYARYPASLSVALCVMLIVASWLVVPAILFSTKGLVTATSSITIVIQFAINATVILIVYTLSHQELCSQLLRHQGTNGLFLERVVQLERLLQDEAVRYLPKGLVKAHLEPVSYTQSNCIQTKQEQQPRHGNVHNEASREYKLVKCRLFSLAVQSIREDDH